MRLRFLTSIAGRPGGEKGVSFAPGQVGDWPDDEDAKRLIAAGKAEPAGKQIERAVRKPPRTAAKKRTSP